MPIDGATVLTRVKIDLGIDGTLGRVGRLVYDVAGVPISFEIDTEVDGVADGRTIRSDNATGFEALRETDNGLDGTVDRTERTLYDSENRVTDTFELSRAETGGFEIVA